MTFTRERTSAHATMIALVVAMALAVAAPAIVLSPIDNPAPQAEVQFGFSVSGLGDVDGDETDDFAVGSLAGGVVSVISGSSGTVLRAISDPDDLTGTSCEPTTSLPSPCAFGFAVARVGDLDADGIDDLAVGSPGPLGAVSLPCGIVDPNEFCPQHGRALVFSPATGALLIRVEQHPPNQGFAVAGLGDVNGDGVPDVAVVSSGVIGGGLVGAFSGADGSTLWTTPKNPATALVGLGPSIAPIQDINGDGSADLVVGAPCHSPPPAVCVGRAYVLSGADGTTVRLHENPQPLDNDAFGAAVAAVGDQDADGVVDYAVGEPGAAASSGTLIHLFSGTSGAAIGVPLASPVDQRNPPTGTQRGLALASVDDRNGDGVNDFWVGGAKTGEAHLMTRLGDVLLSASDPESQSGFGFALSAIGVLPGGMGRDIVVGAPQRPVSSLPAAGAVFVVRFQADLQVEKSAGAASAVPGDTITYTVTVTNPGPAPAVDFALSDAIPAATTVVPESLQDDPECAFIAPLAEIRCALTTLSAGGVFAFDFEVRLADDAAVPSIVTNLATASSSTPDPDASNNSATASVEVTCDLIGTAGDDVLVGDNVAQSICGLDGDDHLVGLGGDDTLVGGPGDDLMHGGQGNDLLRGGSGNDALHGQAGDDVLSGGDGDDVLYGGNGFDDLDGGAGTDTCKSQGGGGTVSACE